VIAAGRLGVPTVIHEQNAILGRANRLLSSSVRRIALSFAETSRLKPAEQAKAVTTGNPVRPAIAALRGQPYVVPAAEGTIEILVLGGSQGARILSEIVPEAVAKLPEALHRRLKLSQQARPEDIDGLRRRYAGSVDVELKSFFDDVPARLARAQLVIARAGASTIAELAIVGRPAILVPYPHAADDHQTANARAFAASGAGWTMAQPEFTAARLAQFMEEILTAPQRLAAAAAAAHAFGRPDAAARLADLALAPSGVNGLENAA
jgi:UDP-N-acetylglucosamine--N-acetylmuramyl-(pentapeptide) pyrophosphoryl-undecaprenol N-acetylglucosamine transferase